MEERNFLLRMTARHSGEGNAVAELQLAMLLDGEWTPVEVTMEGSSPYRVFLFSAFLCQNSYLYMNATERGLLLDETRGEAHFRTLDYRIDEVAADFSTTLRSGAPTEQDVRYICERMMACPVSRNLGSASNKRTTLQLAEHRVVVEG